MCDIAADFIERRYPFSRDGASRGQDRLVVMRDVPIMLLREEFVSDTVHHGQKRLAAMKDVPA